MTEDSQEEKMLQVRLAYRYLFDFHDRLRSTIDEFSSQFVGFEYCHADTIYHNRPSFRTNPHDKWLIDYFPLMNYTMLYKHADLSQILSIRTYCDTGVSDFFDEGKKSDLKIREIKSEAKDSNSEIYVGLLNVSNAKGLSKDDLIEIWNAQEDPDDEKPVPIKFKAHSSYKGSFQHTWLEISTLKNKSEILKQAKRIQKILLPK